MSRAKIFWIGVSAVVATLMAMSAAGSYQLNHHVGRGGMLVLFFILLVVFAALIGLAVRAVSGGAEPPAAEAAQG